MSKIICATETQFYDVCAELTKRGIVFIAHRDTLVVELTGGY